MLDVKDLCLHYGSSQILYNVNLDAQAGRISCVMGMNGAGKTSLLKALGGTHLRSGGTFKLDGEELGFFPAHIMARKGIAIVPQGRMIFPLLTVQENLETGFSLLPRQQRCIPDEIYELFPILKSMSHRRGGDLSGGQQQQLAIARALITKPKVLLLDEPTEGIQPNIIQHIGEVIRYLQKKGDMAIVLVEQYFDFAYDLGDEFYVLERGTVKYHQPRHTLTRETLQNQISL